MLMVVTAACRKDNGSSVQLNATEIIFVSKAISASPTGYQLEMIQADGSNRHVIPGINTQPGAFVISHDGKKIAWTVYENGKVHLYVTDKAGGTSTLLASGAPYCDMADWSPDDRKIVFVKGDNSGRAVYIVDVDGQNEKRLTSNTWSVAPKWFPDGNTIAYLATVNSPMGIYTMKADGSNSKRLSPYNIFGGTLSIDPTGHKIAIAISVWELPGRILVLNADGSNLKEVTAGLDHFAIDGMYGGESHLSPAWSPDGKKIVYVSTNISRSEIYVMNSDGTGDTRLAYTNEFNSSPSWSKDGKYIVYASSRTDGLTSDVYIMKANGRSQTSLTQKTGDSYFPVFVTR